MDNPFRTMADEDENEDIASAKDIKRKGAYGQPCLTEQEIENRGPTPPANNA